ncbi:putative capsid protein [Sewage-associated circular DNA virus-24]|uniref:Putative capsid protein n=1 Tax=Sewage-associated circular DNA virus-24 TaxID=1592091 RepID=A0A0B4UI46_9VIRU|nr:putative capsid protein [Sewage-associated circular DNA virus-24]AJD07540.1 putative capsid protein [Sewage-associated circular DNA virus-24]
MGYRSFVRKGARGLKRGASRYRSYQSGARTHKTDRNSDHPAVKGFRTIAGMSRKARRREELGKRKAHLSKAGQVKNTTEGVEGAVHNDLQCLNVNFALGHAKPPKGLGKWNYKHEYGVCLFADLPMKTGVQGQASLWTTCGVQNFIGAPTANNNSFEWSGNPFDLNPYQYTTGGVIQAASTDKNHIQTDVVRMNSIKGEMNFTNLTVETNRLDVYFMICSSNHNLTVTQAWDTILTSEALNQSAGSAATIVNGAVVAGYVNPSSPFSGGSINSYGEEFTKYYRSMRKFWKIKKKLTLCLSSGQTKRLRYNIPINKVLHKEVLIAMNSTGIQKVKGLTMECFVISRGSPVKVFDTAGTTMSPALLEYGFTNLAQYQFQACKGAAERLSFNRQFEGFVQEATAGASEAFLNGADIIDSAVIATDVLTTVAAAMV